MPYAHSESQAWMNKRYLKKMQQINDFDTIAALLLSQTSSFFCCFPVGDMMQRLFRSPSNLVVTAVSSIGFLEDTGSGVCVCVNDHLWQTDRNLHTNSLKS